MLSFEREKRREHKRKNKEQRYTVGHCRIMRRNRKASRNPKEYGMQYVDITINEKITRDMVDTGAKSQFMTKTTSKRLGMQYK